MPTAEAAFIAKIREQIKILKGKYYAYDQLQVYVSGIPDPWEFGRADEFEFDGEEVLIVRVGPTDELANQGVPQFVFPLRHVVATQLEVSEE